MNKLEKNNKTNCFFKIFNILGLIIISSLVITFNIIIGANEKGLRILPISIFLAIIILYLIIKKIILKKNIIIKNKIDLFVLLFMLSTILPLIFKTYCTYQGTVEFILKYFFVYAFYILVRNVVDSKEKVGLLINITLVASLIPMFLSLYVRQQDTLNEKMPLVESIIQNLNLHYDTDYRLTSTFGYANALSMYALFGIFLAVNRLENNKNKILKTMYLIYICFASYIIYFSYSRVILVLYIISIIIYLINKLVTRIKYNKKIIIKQKNIIILGLAIFIIITGFCIFLVNIGLKYTEVYKLSSDSYKENMKYKFNSDTDYEMLLDMSYEGESEESISSINITIIEYNEYLYERTLVNTTVNDLSEPIKLNFKTSEDELLYLQLKITKEGTGTVNINKCYINNDEYALKYKYLPSIISRLIRSIGLKDKSIVQRKQIYEDCLKIAKGHLLIGQGGNTWKKLNLAVEDHIYGVKETHSYFFELLISYGIVGVITFLILIVYTFFKLVKELKNKKESRKEKLLVIIGLFILIIYSFTFDFNMSFLVMLLTTFEYIALLSYNFNEKQKKYVKYTDYIIIIGLICILSVYIKADIAKYCTDDYEKKTKLCSYNDEYNMKYILEQKENEENYLENLMEFMKKEPYYEQLSVYGFYWETIYENLNTFSDEELEKYLSFGIQNFKEILPMRRMYGNEIIGRAELMNKIIYKLNANDKNKKQDVIQNAISEIKEIMKSEYDENITNLKAQSRNWLDQKIIDAYVKLYNKIMTNNGIMD